MSHEMIEEFADIYASRQELDQRLLQAPEIIRDVLNAGLHKADERLAELAQDETVRAHYVELGAQVVQAAQELEAAAPTLESLGMHDELEAKRNQLEAQRRGPKMAAASYFFGDSAASGLKLVLNPPAEDPAERLAPALAQAAPWSAEPIVEPGRREQGERSKRHLTIHVDPNNHIAINGRPISLNRDVQIAAHGNEAAGRQLRVAALRYLASRPGEMLMRGDIVKAIMPELAPDSKQAKNLWGLHVKPFLEASPTFDRKPIITADTSTPKKYKYGLTEFDVTIEDTERTLRPKDDAIYTLPDGTEVAGKSGRILHLLERATPQRPLVQADIEPLYTADELAKFSPEHVRSLLSGMVSVARRSIAGTDLEIVPVKIEERYPDTNKRKPAYYMTTKAEAGPAADADRGADEPDTAGEGRTVAASQEDGGAAAAEEGETELSAIPTLYEAAVLAKFLDYHRSALRKKGLEILPPEVAIALNDKVLENPDNLAKAGECDLIQLREQVFNKVMLLLGDGNELNKAVNALQKGDPREDLLIALLSYHSPDDSKVIKDLLTSHPELEVTFDASRQMGFRIMQVRRNTVTRSGRKL